MKIWEIYTILYGRYQHKESFFIHDQNIFPFYSLLTVTVFAGKAMPIDNHFLCNENSASILDNHILKIIFISLHVKIKWWIFIKKNLLIWESNPRCMNTWSSWFHKNISKISKTDLELEYTTVWSTYHAKRETRAEFNPFIELSKESGPPNIHHVPLSTFLDSVHEPWKHFFHFNMK